MTSWINTCNAEPKAFYPYTSAVMDRFFSVDYGDNPSLKAFREDLISLFVSYGIKAAPDNKIVFEMKDTNTGRSIFFGFYDWTFSIGFSVRSDSWIRPIIAEGEGND